MSKVDPLTPINASYTGITKLNAHLQKIEDAFANTLSRDGSTPNQMDADIDMNDNQLINVKAPILEHHAATKGYIDGLLANGAYILPTSSLGNNWDDAISEDLYAGWATALTQPGAYVYPEETGCVADGGTTRTDNATNLQAALTLGALTGRLVFIGHKKKYAFGSRLTVASNTGFAGDGTGELIMLTAAGKFDNTADDGVSRYAADAVGIYSTGATKPVFKDFKITSYPVTDGLLIRPFHLKDCIDPLIQSVEITDFTEAELISINGCTRPRVMFCHIHDCEVAYTAVRRQLTGIGVDNDSVLDSTDIQIRFNIVENLTASAAMILAWGYETDAFNIIGQTTTGIIENNIVRVVGEGVDSFGQVHVKNNLIEDAYVFGIKFIHAASNSDVFGNTVVRPGLAGVVVNYTTTYVGHATNIRIFGNTIRDVDPDLLWNTDSAGILLVAGADTYGLRHVVVSDNWIDCGTNGEFGVKATGTNTGSTCRIYDNVVVNAQTEQQSITSSYQVGRTLRQTFTAASSYWTKPLGAKLVKVQLWGGGGGGGGGARVASGTAASGGGGGGGGGYVEATYEASTLADDVLVTIGAGGPGGNGATVNGNPGSAGTAGSLSSWDSSGVLRARGGGPGAGGVVSGGSYGGAGGDEFTEGGSYETTTFGGDGGYNSVGLPSADGGGGGGGGSASAAGNAGGDSLRAGAGGGSGGGVATSPANAAGGSGGRVTGVYTGAAGGAGANGISGTQGSQGAGAGASGGSSNASGAGKPGSVGAVGGGGGSGGGVGVSANGGAGGYGGAGYAIITTYF
jgi:hypothetical protein